MMQSKVTLVNSNQNWSQKRRYKINNVVSYLGSIYQNSTGINTDPSLLTDWVTVNKVNNEVQTYTEILTGLQEGEKVLSPSVTKQGAANLRVPRM